jgi:hypothetical protein
MGCISHLQKYRQSAIISDWKEGVGCGVWGVGKETSFICGGENFFIGTDLKIEAEITPIPQSS